MSTNEKCINSPNSLPNSQTTTIDIRTSSASEKDAPLEAAEALILVVFDDDDTRNPINYSYTKKWLTTIIAVVFTILVAAATTAYNMGFPSMITDLNCTHAQATLGLSLYGIGFAVVPLVSSSFSEEFGRRPLYIVSVSGFFLMHLVVALARNIQLVIAARALQGAFGSTGATVVAGTIADIWSPKLRGVPLTFFAVLAFCGNGLGALISGWIEMHPRLGWRWIQWIPCIFTFFYGIFLYFFMPETRPEVILRQIANAIRKETGDSHYRAPTEMSSNSIRDMIWVSCTRPIYLLLTEPICMGASLWIGFAWGVYYCMIQTIPRVFRTLHNFNSGEVGTVYVTMVAGSFLGILSNLIQERLFRKYQHTRGPEARLIMGCAGAILFPASMYLFAWTATPSFSWGISIFAITLYIWSSFIIYLGVFSYLPDCYGPYASSALAGQSLFRSLTGAIFPLFVDGMFIKMGFTWANTLFASLAVALIPVPFVLFFCGASIRKRSKYASGA